MTLKTYTTNQVEEILQVSKRTLYRYIDKNQIEAIKVGREWRITEEALKDFLKTGTDKNYLDK